MQSTIGRLVSLGLTEDELRRVFENELAQVRGQLLLRAAGRKS
jgi:hypothetical protein